MMAEVGAARVYAAISSVTRALARRGIAKGQQNRDSGYSFRGIDDIYNRLAPLLARHKLCMLPHLIAREQREHRTASGDLIFSVCVHARFEIVSVVDGSTHNVQTFGEAMDSGDKATNKAMSAAFKYAVIQTFCIPVGATEDADASTPPKLSAGDLVPVQGWLGWAEELRIVAGSCESHEALDRLQATHRERLRALSRAEPSAYAELGQAIQARRAGFARLVVSAAA